MFKFSTVEADMERARGRCPACARQQLQIENGQYVPGDEVKGQLLSTPRGGGSSRKARAAAASPAGSSRGSRRGGGGRDNVLAQHGMRPEEIICNHCLCSNAGHEDVGPNGQRCCGNLREGVRDRVCEVCKFSEECKAWSKSRLCPIAVKMEEATVAVEGVDGSSGSDAATATDTTTSDSSSNGSSSTGSSSNGSSSNDSPSNDSPSNGSPSNGNTSNGSTSNGSTGNGRTSNGGSSHDNTSNGSTSTGGSSHGSTSNGRRRSSSRGSSSPVLAKPCKTEGRAEFCKCCTCPCAEHNPHKFDDNKNWVSRHPEVQRANRICLPCWGGWCIPMSGTKRKLVGATLEPEEPFARQWRPGRDADVYVLTGLFDETTGLLPRGGFPHAVFGDSLRYFKGLIGRVEASHALREAGILPGDRSGAIGEAWSGGGSMYPPERPAGARKVVAAPLRQGEGANRHFSRQHGRRDHNWQWDMMKSPWSLALMQKGRLALGVSEEEADEFEEAGIIAFPGHVVKHKDSVKNGGYGKTIGTLVLRSPESAFVCVQVQGERRGQAVAAADELGVELPPRFEQKGRFKFAINELDAWAMVGGAARNDAEHAVVCGRKAIPNGEPGEGFVRVAFNMRWGWQDDPRV